MSQAIVRRRAWFISFAALLAFFGALGEGCGDDTSPSSPTEGGAPDSAKTDSNSEGGAPDASPADAMKEAAPCVDASFNVATFDSGNANWACFQAGCPGDLNTCAAECDCNSSLAAGLDCAADAAPLADGAVDTAAQQVCVNARLLRLTTDAGKSVLMCLNGLLARCLLHTGDGGDGAVGAHGDGGAADSSDGASE